MPVFEYQVTKCNSRPRSPFIYSIDSMNFFGLTYLGPEYTFAPYVRNALCLQDFSDDEVLRCFDGFVAECLHNQLRVEDVRAFLLRLYVSEPPEVEVKFFVNEFSKFSNDLPISAHLTKTSKFMTREQFQDFLTVIRTRLEELDGTAAAEYRSYLTLTFEKNKGTSMKASPTEKYRAPLTTSHQVGWHTQLPHEKSRSAPKNSCAETQFAAEMIKSGFY